jgi:hypothetical protein
MASHTWFRALTLLRARGWCDVDGRVQGAVVCSEGFIWGIPSNADCLLKIGTPKPPRCVEIGAIERSCLTWFE